MDLTFKGNNIYRNGFIIEYSNGDCLLFREQLEIEGTLKDDYYTVRKPDRLDRLAYKYYSRYTPDASKYWWVIADANKIHNPLDLSELVGSEILIPNILNILLKLD